MPDGMPIAVRQNPGRPKGYRGRYVVARGAVCVCNRIAKGSTHSGVIRADPARPPDEEPMTSAPIDPFILPIKHAAIPGAGAFAADAVLDATVPNWRFAVCGSVAVEAELARWFADPGRFEELTVTPLPDGALVEFVLVWEEDGEPHMSHQAHRLTMRDGLIANDTAWCGGRWGAALQAEMAEAAADA